MFQEEKEPNFRFEFSNKDLLCKVTGSGSLNFEKTTRAIKYVANHSEFNSNFRLIVDLREMNYHPSYKEFLGIVDTLKLLHTKFKNKIALVTAADMHILAKLAGIYCNSVGIKMQSFTNPRDAGLWIFETK